MRPTCRSAALVLVLLWPLAGCSDQGASPEEPPSGSTGSLTPPSRSLTPGPQGPSDEDGLEPRAPGLPTSLTLLPPVTLEHIATFDAPIDTAQLADGTVLIAERAGIVRVLFGTSPGQVVVDVSDRTTTDGERGLLSIAVAPWGDELFLSLTDAAGNTLVEAHPLEGTTVSGPPRTIYTLEQPYANHNGGPILFLPDTTLLIGLGDGGGGGDPLGSGQDRSTPLGALIRLDVRDGRVVIPSDNPYLELPGAAREIVAIGLRNPWRIALDGARGELWIADVGRSEREEINRVTLEELRGANFGWALREGDVAYLGDAPDDHVPPLFDYPHGPGCSVTGGLVYRGSALAELVGGYVFADLCDGRLRILMKDGTTVEARDLGVSGTRIVGFGTDADGELLVLELGGRVLRLAPA